MKEYPEAELPAAWQSIAAHTKLALRFDVENQEAPPRFYVLEGDWNDDGRKDVALTMPGFCGNRCCIWYLYVATSNEQYRFLDMFSFGEVPPRFTRLHGDLFKVELETCEPFSTSIILEGSVDTGFQPVEEEVGGVP